MPVCASIYKSCTHRDIWISRDLPFNSESTLGADSEADAGTEGSLNSPSDSGNLPTKVVDLPYIHPGCRRNSSSCGATPTRRYSPLSLVPPHSPQQDSEALATPEFRAVSNSMAASTLHGPPPVEITPKKLIFLAQVACMPQRRFAHNSKPSLPSKR